MAERQTILVVEDERAISDTIVYALQSEGMVPLVTTTGQEARMLLEQRKVALVVLDVGLPDVNGFDLCREIRASSQVPVIFLTARSQEVDRVVGLEIGGDDYLVKPFSPRELAARVRAVLRRSRAAAPGQDLPRVPAPAQPFSVDHERKLIHYWDEPLQLSRYEYRILNLLIRRPGWVFSRERIMELVWEEPQMSLERTVDAHIKNLRAKLRAIRPGKSPIRTHHGLGYSLREYR